MSETTLSALMARFVTVLEAAPLALKPTRDAFSHDRQPNTLLDGAYYLEDGGLVSDRSLTNLKAARIDRIVLYVAAKLKFDAEATKQTMETTLVTAERYLKADGLANGYHVALAGGRRLTRPKASDFLIASLPLTVDFDFNEGTS